MTATDFDTWVASNPVSDQMYWKKPAEGQFEKFQVLAEAIGEPMQVISHHTSKSIKLPVVAFRVHNGWFILRDNFYGVNLCCLWDFAPTIPLSSLYATKDFAWYQEEMEKLRGYSYRGWTDDELADPRILRVRVHPLGVTEGVGYWKVVTGDRKDRWAKRAEDTEWYSRDWSSGKLVPDGPRNDDGTFGPDTVFYVTGHAYAEGISNVVDSDALKPYEPGKTKFTLDIKDYDDALEKMKVIMGSVRVS